jgi:hypothetical protein
MFWRLAALALFEVALFSLAGGFSDPCRLVRQVKQLAS